MSRRLCPYCGKPFDVEHIPQDVRELAVRAGARPPVWYVGRIDCPATRRDSSALVADDRVRWPRGWWKGRS